MSTRRKSLRLGRRRRAPTGRVQKRVNGGLPAPVTYLPEARRLFPQARVILRSYPDVIGVSVGLRRQGSGGKEAAFIVAVRQGAKAIGSLPSELLGVPVDVEPSPVPALRRSVAGGMLTQRPGGGPPGHVGFMARDGAGAQYALTAMHVLIREAGGDRYPFRGGPYFPVDVATGGGFIDVGDLQAGEFTDSSDIACVKLEAEHAAAPQLFGTSIQLGTPADPGGITLGAPALMVIPDGPREVTATLVDYPYEGWFACDAGVLHFNDLLKFRVGASRIESGWSGSVLFDPFTGRPLTIVSFGTDEPDAQGECFAFGFPLHLHYAAWGLRPV